MYWRWHTAQMHFASNWVKVNLVCCKKLFTTNALQKPLHSSSGQEQKTKRLLLSLQRRRHFVFFPKTTAKFKNLNVLLIPLLTAYESCYAWFTWLSIIMGACICDTHSQSTQHWKHLKQITLMKQAILFHCNLVVQLSNGFNRYTHWSPTSLENNAALFNWIPRNHSVSTPAFLSHPSFFF